MAGAKLPRGFVDLGSLHSYSDRCISVIGLVTDIMPPVPTKGTDMMSTFSIVDDYLTGSGQRVKFFARDSSRFPNFGGLDDVIILRDIKMSNFNGSDILLSTYCTKWTVLRKDDLREADPNGKLPPCFRSPQCPNPSKEEVQYAIQVFRAHSGHSFSNKSYTTMTDNPLSQATAQSTRRPGEKFSLIKDVCVNNFYDLVGQAVKIFSSGERLELYVTDYTENVLLYNYEAPIDSKYGVSRDGDEFGFIPTPAKHTHWKGPYGKFTLNVTLFPPHAAYAEAKLREGSFVSLRNVRIKVPRDGGRIEGVMHTDKNDESRVGVRVVSHKTDDRVKDILRRKKKIEGSKDEEETKKNSLGFSKKRKSEEPVDEPAAKCSKISETPPTSQTSAQSEPPPAAPKGRSAKRNRNKKLRSDQDKVQAQAPTGPDNLPPTPPLTDPSVSASPPDASAALTAATTTVRPSHLALNPSVRCQYASSYPSRSLDAVRQAAPATHAYATPRTRTACTLPFQNLFSHATVRVVDFFPHDVADFCVRERVDEFACLAEGSDAEDEDADAAGSIASAPSVGSVSGDEDEDDADAKEDRGYERGFMWKFRVALLLEDAVAPKVQRCEGEPTGPRPDQLLAYVAEEDAEFLFDMTACNLRRRKDQLAQLKQKMETLCGRGLVGGKEAWRTGKENFEEPDQEAAFPQPFHCCLKEYGVKVGKGEWERKWRIFGTAIA